MQERISFLNLFCEHLKVKNEEKNCIVYYCIFIWKININANAQMSIIKALKMFKY